MADEATITTMVPYTAPTVEKIDLSNLDLKRLKTVIKDRDKQRAYDLLIANNGVMLRYLALIAGWWFVEYGNDPDRQWWGYDQRGSDFSASVLQSAMIGVMAPEAIDGLAKVIDAIIPF